MLPHAPHVLTFTAYRSSHAFCVWLPAPFSRLVMPFCTAPVRTVHARVTCTHARFSSLLPAFAARVHARLLPQKEGQFAVYASRAALRAPITVLVYLISHTAVAAVGSYHHHPRPGYTGYRPLLGHRCVLHTRDTALYLLSPLLLPPTVHVTHGLLWFVLPLPFVLPPPVLTGCSSPRLPRTSLRRTLALQLLRLFTTLHLAFCPLLFMQFIVTEKEKRFTTPVRVLRYVVRCRGPFTYLRCCATVCGKDTRSRYALHSLHWIHARHLRCYRTTRHRILPYGCYHHGLQLIFAHSTCTGAFHTVLPRLPVAPLRLPFTRTHAHAVYTPAAYTVATSPACVDPGSDYTTLPTVIPLRSRLASAFACCCVHIAYDTLTLPRSVIPIPVRGWIPRSRLSVRTHLPLPPPARSPTRFCSLNTLRRATLPVVRFGSTVEPPHPPRAYWFRWIITGSPHNAHRAMPCTLPTTSLPFTCLPTISRLCPPAFWIYGSTPTVHTAAIPLPVHARRATRAAVPSTLHTTLPPGAFSHTTPPGYGSRLPHRTPRARVSGSNTPR